MTQKNYLSEKDLLINGIDPEAVNVSKGNQRQACMCLLKEHLIHGGYKRGRCLNRLRLLLPQR